MHLHARHRTQLGSQRSAGLQFLSKARVLRFSTALSLIQTNTVMITTFVWMEDADRLTFTIQVNTIGLLRPTYRTRQVFFNHPQIPPNDERCPGRTQAGRKPVACLSPRDVQLPLLAGLLLLDESMGSVTHDKALIRTTTPTVFTPHTSLQETSLTRQQAEHRTISNRLRTITHGKTPNSLPSPSK